MREIAVIAVAGALGAVSRYGVGLLSYRALGDWCYRWLGVEFPIGTLVVNVAGCFLLAVVMHVGLATDLISPLWRVGVTIGFLGAFTTFSTFGYETIALIEDGAWWPAALNVAANVVVSMTAVVAGLAAGRLLVGGA